MSELELKIEKLIKDQILITDSEAKDLAYLICELPEIKGGRVGAEVIKPETFKRINAEQKTDFWDNGEDKKVCKNCYWFCKGDEGRFCMKNCNIYLHHLFNNWKSEKCGCTNFQKGKHFYYG